MDYTLRLARLDEERELRELIAHSIRTIGRGDYTAEQIEAALEGAFGVDTALIRDGTYYAIESGGRVVACGGWSRRRTLFGSDARPERDDSWADPQTDAAKIRAFFVDPTHARRGLGRMLLERCELEASRAGFTRLELMATLPGLRLYEKFGYSGGALVEYPLAGGLTIRFVPMHKRLTR